ncbi:hypothetical protein V8J88_12955 [Massilia sp. W12]|uniref:hypothetical protein n=1 Tax=Massilia sp. W12 TaxID=3126507 RepID=UPI0030CC70C7
MPKIDANGNLYLQADCEYEEPLKTWIADILGVPNLNLNTHPPLLADPSNPYAPTAKTGVALGLLDLCPGGVIKIIRHVPPTQEIAFANAVGRIAQGKLLVKLPHRAPYGIWHELGAQREKVFNLAYTSSLQVQAGDMHTGDPALTIKKLQFSGELDGHKVYGRAVGPNRIAVCTSISLEAVKADQFENLQLIDL